MFYTNNFVIVQFFSTRSEFALPRRTAPSAQTRRQEGRVIKHSNIKALYYSINEAAVSAQPLSQTLRDQPLGLNAAERCTLLRAR